MLKHEFNAPDWMVIDAVRYAIGRRSYQVGVTTSWLIAAWDGLSDSVRQIIKNDIESEFSVCERTGRWDHLGHHCDIENWKSVRNLWSNQ